MISKYQKEIDEYLKNGGTITQDHYGSSGVEDMVEGKLLQESVTTVRDLEPHEVKSIKAITCVTTTATCNACYHRASACDMPM